MPKHKEVTINIHPKKQLTFLQLAKLKKISTKNNLNIRKFQCKNLFLYHNKPYSPLNCMVT